MARYRMTAEGRGEGTGSRLGTANSGGRARADGWSIGGQIDIRPDPQHPDRELLEFSITDGSGSRARAYPSMVVRQAEDGEPQVRFDPGTKA